MDSSNGQYGNMSCTVGGSGYCPQLTFDAATNWLTKVGSTSTSHDAAGDMTYDGTYTYQYDAEGRVVSSTGPAWQYPVYNALGQRIEDYQSAGPSDSMTLTYPRDIFGHRTGTWDQHPSANWTGWDVYFARVAGQRLNMGGSSSFLAHADAIGSTNMVTDQAGTVVWDTVFYPWGQVWQEGGTRQYRVFADLGWPVNDPLYPSATRGYKQSLGRWMTPDKLGGDVTNPQSLNRYAYVNNNPTTLNDPEGLSGGNPADRCSDPAYYYSHAYCGGSPPADCGQYDNGSCIGDPTCDNSFGLMGPINCGQSPGAVLGFPIGGSGGVGGGSTGTSASAPPAGQPPLAGMGNALTASIQGEINFNFFNFFNWNFAFGFAIDTKGCVAAIHTKGGLVGSGTRASIGVSVSGSNAETVHDLGGPFSQTTGTVGEVLSGEGGFFFGKSPRGRVVGGSLGATVGTPPPLPATAATGATTTQVTPVAVVPVHGASCVN